MKRSLLIPIMVIVLAGSLLSAQVSYADDGSNYEVGIWWVNDYPGVGNDLSNRDDSAQGFGDRLDDAGWSQREWGDNNVLEIHFKKVGSGNGDDDDYTDSEDIAYFAGHGWYDDPNMQDPDVTCMWVATQNDDMFVEYMDCELGDVDLEWLLADCCELLNDDSYDSWHDAMDGLHLICGSKDPLYDVDSGVHVSDLLIDDGLFDVAQTIKSSWFSGMDVHHSNPTVIRVLGETLDCGNDYIWGQGTVCSDPSHDSVAYLWYYTCT